MRHKLLTHVESVQCRVNDVKAIDTIFSFGNTNEGTGQVLRDSETRYGVLSAHGRVLAGPQLGACSESAHVERHGLAFEKLRSDQPGELAAPFALGVLAPVDEMPDDEGVLADEEAWAEISEDLLPKLRLVAAWAVLKQIQCE